MNKECRTEGSLDATMLLIGEAPGSNEMKEGRPFVGMSGWKLRTWWKDVGLERNQFMITNVLFTQPRAPGGLLEEALRRGTLSKDEVPAGQKRVRDLICAMPNLRLIIPVGNYALNAVLPLYGKTVWTPKLPGITDMRGSILFHTCRDGRDIKTIPTIHPAAVMRQAQWERR